MANVSAKNKPESSRTYLVSITRRCDSEGFTFNYIAYYNADTDKWHKCDGFEDDSIKEIITEQINAWQYFEPYLY
ncbi:hypothetical protein [Flavobacterium johnsoniae]|uniref:hypothetical protein n=1 Tax=Flavobacterium johnsoniae TaxID=986 RepID=UPI0005C4FBE7|nr:hypothetical protein [Flavobacterium johnsoniae]OXE99265.1 hypothetical protein B0A63_11775 [Flavobacterium johnsoniae UW101]WQG80811.1 hypothetical protein SR927_22690 [Flavobacterium johnsoniae UW101]